MSNVLINKIENLQINVSTFNLVKYNNSRGKTIFDSLNKVFIMLKRCDVMFNIGEIVFIPVFGAGCVLSIEDRDVHGEIGKYYIINLIISSMNIMVPVDSKESERIRRVIKPEEYVKLLQIFGDCPKKLPGKWLDRYKHYKECIKSGSIYKLSGVLRDISGLSKDRKLSKSEIKIFNEVLDMVSSEIALVLLRDFNETKADILNLLNPSYFC